jgi:adenine-specific DNA-methyltransferase
MGSVVALKLKPKARKAAAGAPRLPIGDVPAQALTYPELRYMGSKKRLLPWIGQILDDIDFESALDPFSGTGSVGYLMKSMGRRVVAADFLEFTSLIARATIENNSRRLEGPEIKTLLSSGRGSHDFIEKTFKGIFYTAEDLRFLDRVSGNIRRLKHPQLQALAYAALFRSCLKRQPRGVFTVSGDLARYDDGRRDLKLSIADQSVQRGRI